MSAFGTKRTCRNGVPMSAFGGKADIVPNCSRAMRRVRFLCLPFRRQFAQPPTSELNRIMGAELLLFRPRDFYFYHSSLDHSASLTEATPGAHPAKAQPLSAGHEQTRNT